MRAVVVGTGKIGCGYLAPLFADAGWQVTLGARSAEKAARIRAARGFWVTVTGPSAQSTMVDGIDAAAVDSPEFCRAVSAADVVALAVGVGAVRGAAGALARALATRPVDRPVDVWVVENGDCAATLRDAVQSVADAEGLRLPPVGFAGGVAHVAVGRGDWSGSGRPEFVGDDARRLAVDGTGLLTPLPDLEGVWATGQYLARLREKLYIFNAGHAISAYLGWLRGHRTLAEAVADPQLRPIIVGCLIESRKAVIEAYPELATGEGTSPDVHEPVADALRRFADPDLADPILRVARDPIRKLAPHDRLLGPVRLIRDATGGVPAHFALGVAGALLYRGDGDEQARNLAGQLSRDGVMAVLERLCGLPRGDAFAEAVATRYRGFILTAEGAIFPPVHTTDALLAPALDTPVEPARTR